MSEDTTNQQDQFAQIEQRIQQLSESGTKMVQNAINVKNAAAEQALEAFMALEEYDSPEVKKAKAEARVAVFGAEYRMKVRGVQDTANAINAEIQNLQAENARLKEKLVTAASKSNSTPEPKPEPTPPPTEAEVKAKEKVAEEALAILKPTSPPTSTPNPSPSATTSAHPAAANPIPIDKNKHKH